MVPDTLELGRAIADALAAAPWQKAMDVDIRGMAGAYVADLVDAIAAACTAAGVALKSIAVDAAHLSRPADAPFANGFYRNGQLVVVDIDLDDLLVVRRA